jgi:polyphenol oxidase
MSPDNQLNELSVQPPPEFFGRSVFALTTNETAGDMSITNPDQRTPSINRKKIFGLLGTDNLPAFIMPQHGSGARFVSAKKIVGSTDRIKADALVTDINQEVCLVLTPADCYPLLLFDPTEDVIGLIHAGRLPIQKGIIQNTLRMFQMRDSHLENIRIWIGPGICKECYIFDEEAIKEQERLSLGWEDYLTKVPGQKGLYQLSLLKRIVAELSNFTGSDKQRINPANILESGLCTFEGPFFSHRKSRGSGVKPRNLSVIGFR